MSLIRINKRIADIGLASRREADALIESGKVLVNGSKAVIGQKVSETDEIRIKDKDLKEKVYLAAYKGRGIITHSPATGETDLMTKLTSAKSDLALEGVFPVGRLDKDSEGLIVLTNDGRVTGPLLDPNAKHEKEYEVMVDKPINGPFLKYMTNGVNIEGYKTKLAKIEKKSDKRFYLTLTEGKKHQVRRMCAALGYQVQSLKRVRVMNIELGSLKPNQYRKFNQQEVRMFLEELGIR